MNIFLWVVQILLALMFAFHGWLLFSGDSPQARQMPYISAMSTPLRRFVGVVEFLGAAGLILPALTHILPWLTPLAAAGLVIVMALAVVFHIQRREYPNLGFNALLLILSLVVAYGRFVIAPL